MIKDLELYTSIHLDNPVIFYQVIILTKFVMQLLSRPRNISQSKAQKYSNSFQMHEPRGYVNGIDTCSVTQFRNLLLCKFGNEKIVSHQFANNYRDTAK